MVPYIIEFMAKVPSPTYTYTYSYTSKQQQKVEVPLEAPFISLPKQQKENTSVDIKKIKLKHRKDLSLDHINEKFNAIVSFLPHPTHPSLLVVSAVLYDTEADRVAKMNYTVALILYDVNKSEVQRIHYASHYKLITVVDALIYCWVRSANYTSDYMCDIWTLDMVTGTYRVYNRGIHDKMGKLLGDWKDVTQHYGGTEADGGMVTVNMYIQVTTSGCINSSSHFCRYEGGGED
jgi:hypothetical protein